MVKRIKMMVLPILLDYNNFKKPLIEYQEIGKKINCFRQLKEHLFQIKRMAKRTTGSVTPGKIRRISAGISNTQPAFDDVEDFSIDENEYDESKRSLSM